MNELVPYSISSSNINNKVNYSNNSVFTSKGYTLHGNNSNTTNTTAAADVTNIELLTEEQQLELAMQQSLQSVTTTTATATATPGVDKPLTKEELRLKRLARYA